MTDTLKKKIKKILFDESHGELLRLEDATKLCKLLEDLNYKVSIQAQDTTSFMDAISEEKEVDVLVLGAPTQPYYADEMEAIEDFVCEQGKSLLIVSNYDSLRTNESRVKMNQLLTKFDLQIQQLVSYPPKTVEKFFLHSISSDIKALELNNEPAYLKSINQNPQIIATLPDTEKTFLAAVEKKPGRVIAIGDFSLFQDDYIEQLDNTILTKNIFRWLCYQNFLDLQDARIDSEIRYGKAAIFSITAVNSYLPERLDEITCSLESDAVAHIEKPALKIPPLLTQDSVQLQWLIEPRQLGKQTLLLTIDLPTKFDSLSLKFFPAIEFNCVPDAEIQLLICNNGKPIQERIETHKNFDVKAVIRWEENAKKTPLSFHLESYSSSLKVEFLDAQHWRVTALNPGNWELVLTAKETQQTVTRLIHVVPSPEFNIATVEQDIVAPLSVKIEYLVSKLWSELNTEKVRQIPFRLLTPDGYVRQVYRNYRQERLLDALYDVQQETQNFPPLVNELLFYIAPMYSPESEVGCCIPYDPKLASRLVQKSHFQEENIAYNFSCIENFPLYGKGWLEGNIAALLLHEKYGHGFFYNETKLGQQLAILYRHGLLRTTDDEELRSPYLRSLHEEYGRAIQMLYDSALILNEGFATWVELTGLQNLSELFEQTAHRRKDFLFRDTQLVHLVKRSYYFREFNPGSSSKYRMAYDWLKDIQDRFGFKLGLQCAIAAVVKAADVNFGITEREGQIDFALGAKQIEELLLDNRKGYEAGADRRMRKIWWILRDYCQQNQNELKSKMQSTHLHGSVLVERIVYDTLKW